MKKNFFAAVAAFVCGILVLTSCSSEDQWSEGATLKVTKKSIVVTKAVFDQETKIASKVEGNLCKLTMSNGGEVVNEGITRYDGDGEGTASFGQARAIEAPIDDHTKQVMIVQPVEGLVNTFEVQDSYTVVAEVKPDTVVVKDTVVVTPDPVVLRETFAADTTMVYRKSSTGTTWVTMQHKLYKVTEWSDGRQDSAQIWNKTINVGRAKVASSKGKAYTVNYAKDLQYSTSLVWFKSEVSHDEAFSITTRKGEFVYVADYFNDGGFAMKSDHHVSTEESTVKCKYEGYEAIYDFHWAANFAGQEEVNKNLEDETRGNHTYRYEANSIGSWKISLNGAEIGIHKVDIEVYRY